MSVTLTEFDVSSSLDVRNVGDLMIVRFSGSRMLESSNVERTGRALNAVVAKGCPKTLVIDFEEIEYLCTTALSMLIPFREFLMSNGCRLQLCGLKPWIREVFEVTKLDRLFDMT